MKFNDILIAAIFLILAVTVVVSAQGFPPSPGQPVGPALFPTVVGIASDLQASFCLSARLEQQGRGSGLRRPPTCGIRERC